MQNRSHNDVFPVFSPPNGPSAQGDRRPSSVSSPLGAAGGDVPPSKAISAAAQLLRCGGRKVTCRGRSTVGDQVLGGECSGVLGVDH